MNNKNNQTAIKLHQVSKKYTIHFDKPTLAEEILNGKFEEFYALKNVNLTVKKGERIGIIGANGSGKTTLLKLITGITYPSDGSVTTQGKVVSLIDLEAGFHPDLTGVQNIYLNGTLLGMSKNELKSKMKEIVKFADIGKFIASPLHTYSSGMVLRLGFSIAIHSGLDTLIMDENFSVGDENFREKSTVKVKSLIKGRKTIIVASHDLNSVKTYCNKIVWLHEGRIHAVGGLNLINKYLKKEHAK